MQQVPEITKSGRIVDILMYKSDNKSTKYKLYTGQQIVLQKWPNYLQAVGSFEQFWKKFLNKLWLQYYENHSCTVGDCFSCFFFIF